MKDCFKNSFEMKVVDINVILEITVLREALVLKKFFLLLVNFLISSRDGKLQFFLKLMRK
jgi:hypothetical protein